MHILAHNIHPTPHPTNTNSHAINSLTWPDSSQGPRSNLTHVAFMQTHTYNHWILNVLLLLLQFLSHRFIKSEHVYHILLNAHTHPCSQISRRAGSYCKPLPSLGAEFVSHLYDYLSSLETLTMEVLEKYTPGNKKYQWKRKRRHNESALIRYCAVESRHYPHVQYYGREKKCSSSIKLLKTRSVLLRNWFMLYWKTLPLSSSCHFRCFDHYRQSSI